jgi:hypothetical protein
VPNFVEVPPQPHELSEMMTICDHQLFFPIQLKEQRCRSLGIVSTWKEVRDRDIEYSYPNSLSASFPGSSAVVSWTSQVYRYETNVEPIGNMNVRGNSRVSGFEVLVRCT